MTADTREEVADRETLDRRRRASDWFAQLRDALCAAFEDIEDEAARQGIHGGGPPGRFQRKTWERPGGGGGEMSIMRGRVFEKVGVNVSTVHGEFPPDFARNVQGASDDPRFWASGVSLVAHMRSPLVPAAHMNTRMIVTTRTWFGGGADLTPTFPFDEDTADFHGALKAACDAHDGSFYPLFKKWCDEYFYLPHRGEARGIGGIFFDSLGAGPSERGTFGGNWDRDFAFARDVGKAFLEVFPRIVRRRMGLEWTPEQREALLVKRGRYVEFNLLYDRGTLFGVRTRGNPEAVLMSMPPEAKWP